MAIFSIISTFIGTLILTFSTIGYFKWINYSLLAHEESIRSLFKQNGRVITGTDKHLYSAARRSQFYMVLGGFLIIVGVGLQVWTEITKLYLL